ncbi:hypothetical protein ACNO6Z_06765 [Aliarcobacter lanthieri]|uniref:hypothetical protein n=1 Tax=Aliarcobacter lanthieri TaxID=1355374 RepID=UPI003AA8C764
MKTFIIQKDDIKSKKWKEGAKAFNIDMFIQSGSPIKAPFFLIKTILYNKKPDGYIVRYLNDYSSFFKTILRLFSEILLVVLCLVFKIDIFWICHNVDKETSSKYMKISEFRRWLFSKFSKKIFVTDALLVEFAKNVFKKEEEKIDYISFGKINSNSAFDTDEIHIAINHIEEQQIIAFERKLIPLVVFCVGSTGTKYLHFNLLNDLIEKSLGNKYYLIPVLAGEFNKTDEGKQLLKVYKDINQILTFKEYTKFSNIFIKEYVDFYWRVYDDWSVPFTLYESTALKKPILTKNIKFLPKIVLEENIGYVLMDNWNNLKDCLYKISTKKELNYNNFLENRTWNILGKKLLEYANDNK